MRRRNNGTKYIVIVMLVVATGYVAINPDLLSIRDPQPTQTYTGSLDVDTTYYELKRTDDYTVSMWADDERMDDIRIYNNDLTEQDLKYLYIRDTTDDWTVNYTINDDIKWTDDGTKMYVESYEYTIGVDGGLRSDIFEYNCSTHYDVNTCNQKGYKWDTNKVPDTVSVNSITELEEPITTTSIWDYLFR